MTSLSFSKVLSQYQFSSVAQSCPTLRDPINRSTPGLPVHHQLPETTQTHVHRVSDAIQPSHPPSSPSPPAPNPSQHQSLSQRALEPEYRPPHHRAEGRACAATRTAPPVGGVCPFASGRPRAPTTPASPARHVSPGALSAPEGGSLAFWVFDVKGPVPTGQFSSSGGRYGSAARVSPPGCLNPWFPGVWFEARDRDRLGY